MDLNTLPLTFAHDSTGSLRHVNDVGNGLSCGCVCPSCGSNLIAKQGAATAHHFAHEGDAVCSGAAETALHLAAKEILAKHMRMHLPALDVTAKVLDSAGGSHSATKSIPATPINFDSVSLEVRLNGLVPDIVTTVGTKTLIVEVAVTHFSDERKLRLLRERGLAAVEIDLSNMSEGWTWDSLTEAVVLKPFGKKWLFNPKSDGLLQAAKKEAETLAQRVVRKNKARSTSIQESHALQRASIPGFRAAIERLNQFLSPENLAKERLRMDAEGPLTGPWQSASRMLGVQWENAPPYINIEVPGEMGSLVDRRVWQSALFCLYIRGTRNKTFTTKLAVKWCVRYFGCRPEFAVLQKYDHLLSWDEKVAMPSASRAVYAYFRYLESKEYLTDRGGKYEVLKRR